MRRDTSKRTTRMRNYNYAFLGSAAVFLLCLIWLGLGFAQYDGMLMKSSSPIGTALHFQRSNADVNISGIYTDTERSVLIVRLTADQQSSLNLPYKPTDYRVYISSDSYAPYADTEVPVLFGRYSTNGDFFLVIPKPKPEVYTLFLMNKNFVATDVAATSYKEEQASEADGLADGQALTDEQMTKNLSLALDNYRSAEGSNRALAVSIQSDIVDVVGMRVTLDPALDSEEYKPKVINGVLLDDNGEFNFKLFFDNVFKESATKTVEGDYKALLNQEKLLRQRINELENRLVDNPDDEGVQKKLTEVKSELSDVEAAMKILSQAYNDYESLEYKPSMFKNILGEAMVMDKKKVEAYNEYQRKHAEELKK